MCKGTSFTVMKACAGQLKLDHVQVRRMHSLRQAFERQAVLHLTELVDSQGKDVHDPST